MSAGIQTHSRPKRSASGRFVRIMIVFVALGPLIGSVILFTGVGLQVAGMDLLTDQWRGVLGLVGAITLMWLPLGYLVGGLAAAGVGLFVALWDRRTGVISWWVALGSAVGMWLLILFGSVTPCCDPDETFAVLGLALAAHVIAALGCTAVARRLLR